MTAWAGKHKTQNNRPAAIPVRRHMIFALVKRTISIYLPATILLALKHKLNNDNG